MALGGSVEENTASTAVTVKPVITKKNNKKRVAGGC
jgi:hypothetical protein